MHIQWKKEWVIPVGVGIASFGVGVGVGYILNRRERSTAKEQIQELQEHQVELDFERVERTREFNLLLHQWSDVAKGLKESVDAILSIPVASPNERFTTLGDIAEVVKDPPEEPWVYNGGNAHPEEDRKKPVVVKPTPKSEPEPERVTIFPDNDPSWNYDEELSKRSKDTPYIIHRDEFFEEEEGRDYRQDTLTFYAGDEILCDSQDVPIYKIDQKVGKLEFGKGSGDPNVVYVRNDKEEMEYEILLDSGYYEVEVRGEDIEDVLTSGDLKHSVRKFRAE